MCRCTTTPPSGPADYSFDCREQAPGDPPTQTFRSVASGSGVAAALAAVEDAQDAAGAVAVGLARRIEAAEAEMSRLRRALEAGWDPTALTAQYNSAVAEKRAAEAQLSAIEVPEQVTAADIRSMVHELGDMTAALDQADAKDMAGLYEVLGLRVNYNHNTRSAVVAINPAVRGFNVGVRGGTRTLTTRLELNV